MRVEPNGPMSAYPRSSMLMMMKLGFPAAAARGIPESARAARKWKRGFMIGGRLGWRDGLVGEAEGSEEIADGNGDLFPVFGQDAAFVGSAGVGVLV